ncbi:run domain Beclin-1-interacting and cysteine-rich domain-containing protein isoform X1 [Diorhabda carinulata]|uniref:run domain Beclin-1-interacting and cysteine-rich domain-containing protein isoform X1 n=1 Tax=Diorhabda carinulata TaxID=1163345 RepID=UPI0025A29021|nr:run domain Beclin-1-interacting and cysteine-rich domain-containing protein isoform X1 [Diorhabda carinulata]
MSEPSLYTLKYQQLLRDLKNTVEGLLMTQVANVWSVFGGLNRFHNIVDKIFKHGCKGSEVPGYYKFIQGLEWLQPENTKSFFSIDCEYRPHIPSHLKTDKSAIWLYRSLENHSLSQKLSWLLSDKTHLSNCYQSYAFLCQEKYAEATLICLRAVERNQASLLSDINPYLFLQKPKEYIKVHRRCSSFPDNHMQKIYTEKLNIRRKTIQGLNDELMENGKTEVIVQSRIKTWHSMPNLLEQQMLPKKKPCSKSKTTPNTPIHSKKLSPPSSKVYSNYRSLQPRIRKKRLNQTISSNSSEVKHVLVDNLNIVEYTPSLSSSQSSGTTLINDELTTSYVSMPETKKKRAVTSSHSSLSVVDSFLPMAGEKDYKKFPKKTFIEDGGMSVLPATTGYFPKPSKGQSLLSFLTSSHFARTNAELDRENAHFSISEAIISAMEQIRCKKRFNVIEEQLDDSDPEIVDLKQKIRLRRTKRVLENQKKAISFSLLSDGKTDTATTVSPCSTSFSDTNASSSDEIEDLEINEISNLEENSGLSMSMASLYSEVDLMKRNAQGTPDGASDILSAEGVAISLISKFSDRQLPRASDLEWLVSEEETHQTLLPLPKSWPVSPDSAEEQITSLRGTQDWAPPRPQLIFTLHPSPIRKELIAKQNYRCAGCSMRVAPKYASRFRYCEYLGRFFCTGCHKNQLSLIPGRVLQKWDFKRYPVSTFSYRLLEQMYTDPLFRVFSLNKNIGKMAKNLELCQRIRLGLHYLKDFIFTCKHAETIGEKLVKEMGSALTEPEVYSMDDLFKIKNGDLVTKMKSLVEICCKHTSECKLCMARGFICECCRADDVIFPWQLRTVSRCQKCGSCYHVNCWRPEQAPCKKCSRIQKRKESVDSSNIF